MGAPPWAWLYGAPDASDAHFLPAEARTRSDGVGQSGLESGPVLGSTEMQWVYE